MMILAQVQPSQIPADPSNWPLYLVLLGCASALGWGIEHLRKSKEIQKLNAEIGKLHQEEIKLAGDHLKELQRCRDAYSQACGTCTKSTNELIVLMRSSADPSSIHAAREKLAAIVSDDVIRTLCSFVEWQGLGRKNDADDLLSYIRDDVCPEVLRIAAWVKIVNHSRFVDEQQQHPLRLEDRSIRPIRDVLRHLTEERKAEVKETLFGALDKLKT